MMPAGRELLWETDHPSDGTYLPGFGVHRELDVLVKSGIAPEDAIRIGTINGAKAIRIDKDHGSIEVGKVCRSFYRPVEIRSKIFATLERVSMWFGQECYTPVVELLKSVKGKLGPTHKEEEEDW